MFSSLVHASQYFKVNNLSLFDITSFDISLFAMTTSVNILMKASIFVLSWNDVNFVDFVNLFTSISTKSYVTSIIEFIDNDNFVMKFIDMNCLDFLSDLKKYKYSYDLCRSYLFLWHKSHSLVNFSICFFHVWKIVVSLNLFESFRCVCVILQWSFVMTLYNFFSKIFWHIK